MTSRKVDGVTTTREWDVTSSMVESGAPVKDANGVFGPPGQGGHVVDAYDASGQRVAQARVADADGLGTATGYVASGKVEDPNTATTSTGDVTATRYYTFGGSTVAVRTNDGKLALMLGDEQGSTSVAMAVTVQAGGALASATLNDAATVTRTSYTPYGELRGADNLAVDKGWLGQVEDRVSADGASGTGLTYLNARYYDPATQRFISPDPLMNPGDPKTLDPYRYADNNPVVFTDASGLFAACSGVSGKKAELACLSSFYKGDTKAGNRHATNQARDTYGSGGAGRAASAAPQARCHSFQCSGARASASPSPSGQLSGPPPGVITAFGQSFLGLATEPDTYGPWAPAPPGVVNPAPGPANPAAWSSKPAWNAPVLSNKWLVNGAKAAPMVDFFAAGLDWNNNYNNRYTWIEDDRERAKISTERTVVTSAAGMGTAAIVVAGLSFAACPFTGVTCAIGIAAVAGVAAYGVESGVGAAYDSGVNDRIAMLHRRDCNNGAMHDLCASGGGSGAA